MKLRRRFVKLGKRIPFSIIRENFSNLIYNNSAFNKDSFKHFEQRI